MPENQQNTANENYAKITDIAKKHNKDISNPADFVKFINDENIAKEVKPYLLTYNTVITDPSDETYTYIDTDVTISNQNKNYHITGIKEDSTMYNISSSTINKMKESYYNNPGFIPVVINKYAKENLNIDTGSTFSGIIKNDANRNFENVRNGSVHEANYVVVDVIDSYNDSGFVTLQSIANNVLSLNTNSFNGVMSKNSNSTLLQTLPIYSPSGFYFATDTISSGSVWEE